MKAGVDNLRKVLPRVAKAGDIVRLSAHAGVLKSVVVGPDWRVAKTTPVEGNLEPVYVHSEPLVKGLDVRAPDLHVNFVIDKNSLALRHGEFRLSVPVISGKSFDLHPPSPSQENTVAGLGGAVRSVASVLDKKERNGVLFMWGNRTAVLVGLAARTHVHSCMLQGSGIQGSGRVAFSKGASEQISKLADPVAWSFDGGSLYFTSADSVLRVGPVMDQYPSDPLGLVAPEAEQMVCEFERDALLFAMKAAASALSKDDIGVTVATCAEIAGGVVFEISAKNVHTKAHAAEKIRAKTTSPTSLSTRVHAKRFLTTLATMQGEVVSVGFSKSTIRLTDGKMTGKMVTLVS